jgi:hypothetical protein
VPVPRIPYAGTRGGKKSALYLLLRVADRGCTRGGNGL